MTDKITTSNANFYSDGDRVILYRGSLSKDIFSFIKKPRITSVEKINGCELTLISRRMTWREWRNELKRIIKTHIKIC